MSLLEKRDEKRDSDSAHSPSDDEKRIGVSPGEFQALGHGDLPPNPDADLSEAERALIVGRHTPVLKESDVLTPPRISDCSGSLTYASSLGSVSST